MAYRTIVLCLGLLCVGEIAAMAMQAGPGCGPANYVFDGNKTRTGHILAVLMNLTSFPTQLGAITSGTSGCQPNQSVQRQSDLEQFIAIADVALEREIAQGQGPYLSAWAELAGCTGDEVDEFARWAQRAYSEPSSGPKEGEALLIWLERESARDVVRDSTCGRGVHA